MLPDSNTVSSPRTNRIKLTYTEGTKKMAHASEIVSAKVNLKLSQQWRCFVYLSMIFLKFVQNLKPGKVAEPDQLKPFLLKNREGKMHQSVMLPAD